MQGLAILAISFVILCGKCAGINFCDMPQCNGVPHLGCNNDLTFRSSCMRSRMLLNMQVYKEYLVKIHNKYREEVASGEIKGIDKASRMPELVWHSKLALIADYHVKLCQHKMNKCIAVSTFLHPACNYGENRQEFDSVVRYSASTNSEKLTFQTEVWMHQVYRLVLRESNGPDIYEIGNILNDKNRYVGCAAAEDSDRRAIRFVLICYYENQLDPKSTIYTHGTFSPENCKDGVSEEYLHLCKSHPDEFD